MDGLIEWVTVNAVTIGTVLSAAAATAAIVGYIIRGARRLWNEVHGRGRVVVIRSSRHPLVGWIEDVQERIFPPAECDPRGVLGRRIDASRFSLFGQPRSDESMLAIVYMKGRTPVAYLSAEYFPAIGGIFFWYIVSLRDGRFKEALSDLPLDWNEITSVKDRISPRLIRKLLQVCSRGRGWNYVVAEVDTDDLDLARKKVGAFQRCAEELLRERERSLAVRLGMAKLTSHPNDPRVFKVDMDFVMPLHDSDMLHEAEAHESPGWLLFAPRQPGLYKAGNDYSIDGAEVRNDLLKTLLLLGYRDPGNDAYGEYIGTVHARLVKDLPDKVRLIHNRNLM